MFLTKTAVSNYRKTALAKLRRFKKEEAEGGAMDLRGRRKLLFHALRMAKEGERIVKGEKPQVWRERRRGNWKREVEEE